MTAFLGQNHLIHALRGRDNYCFALIDTNIGEKEDLDDDEKQAFISMYRCLSESVDELEQELIDDSKNEYFDYEKQSTNQRLNYLFDRIWYRNLCKQIQTYSTENLQEFVANKSKWNEQTKQLLGLISRIVKKRELNPSDVRIKQTNKNNHHSKSNLFIFSKYANVLIPAMIEFDPTVKETKPNDAWNRIEQSITSKIQFICFLFEYFP